MNGLKNNIWTGDIIFEGFTNQRINLPHENCEVQTQEHLLYRRQLDQ